MMVIDSAMAVQFRSSASIAYCRPFLSSDDAMTIKVTMPWDKLKRRRNDLVKNRIQATGKYLGAGSEEVGENEKPRYHPFEDILEMETAEGGEARLTPAETSRTIIEMNSDATLMFSGLINDEVQENIFWPDLAYLTDEHGNIYFQVKNDEDIMQTLTAEDNYVQVIIGLDTREMINEMDLSAPATIDFGIEEIEDEESDFDDDDDDDDDEDGDDGYEGDWVDILEDEEDDGDSDGSLGDWAKLETMRSSHPMYFAKKLAEVASDDPIDFMEEPPVGLAIQGLLRPAFIEEQSVIQKHWSSNRSKKSDIRKDKKFVDGKIEEPNTINGHRHLPTSSEDDPVWADNSKRDNSLGNGTAFYKLEMIKIHLVSAYGHQTSVEVEEYKKARPDAIAHSAAKIIARVNAAGEKTFNAFKSLCWRCKGLQVEEASLIGIDTLGFDLRVCSGTQVQTLRFSFTSWATSEYSAERQLNELLFPKSDQTLQKIKRVQQKES